MNINPFVNTLKNKLEKQLVEDISATARYRLHDLLHEVAKNSIESVLQSVFIELVKNNDNSITVRLEIKS